MLKKILSLLLAVSLVVGILTIAKDSQNIYAAEKTGKPVIKVKLINKKTGVKITINKTKGAEAYDININGIGDAYKDYIEAPDENDFKHIARIEKDGSQTRSYTINGLPKGTYRITVSAMKYETFYEEGERETMLIAASTSDPVTVNIKAAKTFVKEKTYDFSNAKVGDTIKFGAYEQDGIMTNGKEDIEWIVLSKSDSELLVMSKYALDYMSYNYNLYETVTWETSRIRKWLNESFYKTAFTKSERNLINKTKLKNAKNPDFGTSGGKTTKDKVFLLSFNDLTNAKYGFSKTSNTDDINRRCALTPYAAQQRGYTPFTFDDCLTKDGDQPCEWMLRTPGMDTKSHVTVTVSGDLNKYGYASYLYFAIRPAICISLK